MIHDFELHEFFSFPKKHASQGLTIGKTPINDLFGQSTHLQYIQILMSFALGCIQLCSLESTTLQLTLPNLFINLYNIDFEVLPVYGLP